MKDKGSELVYSTDHPVPRKDRAAGKSAGSGSRASGGRVSVRIERKGRAGKTVTVIEGLGLGDAEGERFLKEVKSRLGAGGTLKAGVMEIQGDHREAVAGILNERESRRRSGEGRK